MNFKASHRSTSQKRRLGLVKTYLGKNQREKPFNRKKNKWNKRKLKILGNEIRNRVRSICPPRTSIIYSRQCISNAITLTEDMWSYNAHFVHQNKNCKPVITLVPKDNIRSRVNEWYNISRVKMMPTPVKSNFNG